MKQAEPYPLPPLADDKEWQRVEWYFYDNGSRCPSCVNFKAGTLVGDDPLSRCLLLENRERRMSVGLSNPGDCPGISWQDIDMRR